MEELALHDARSIQNSLSIRWREMENVANELSQQDLSDTAQVSATLRKNVPDITSADFITLVTTDGTEYRSTGLIYPHSEICGVAQGQTERFVARYNESKAVLKENRKEMLVMGVPVNFQGPLSEKGEPVTFQWLFARLGIATLEDELKIDSYGGKGFSSVIDFNGNYIVNMSRSHSIGTFDNFYADLAGAKFQDFASLDDVKQFMSSGGRSAMYADANGSRNIMVFSNLGIADWFFITTVSLDVFDKQTSNIMTIFIGLMVLMVLVFLIVFFLSYKQRKQHEKLKVAQAENKAKTDFLFNMSHDIRTPMNAILGFTDIASNHLTEQARVSDCLTKIKSSGSLLLSLINDILEMSRIEAGKLDVENIPANIEKIGSRMNPMVESLALAKSITYTYEVRNVCNPYVYIDVQHMDRVLVNLLTNAVKYTKDGGCVSFAVEQLTDDSQPGYATYKFIVSDTGVGMTPSFIENNLYQQFARETSSTLSKQQGTGLGLAIVKRIVDTLGGTIEVQSEVDKGTTFTITLTLQLQSEEEIAQNKAEEDVISVSTESRFPLKGKRALLVEDNALNREIGTEVLQDAGILVEVACDGALAVDALKEHGVDYYDFVLMDIQMPVMDGYEATKAIRALPDGDKVLIVAVSANAFEEDRAKSQSVGMNDHIAKPVDVDELFRVLIASSHK